MIYARKTISGTATFDGLGLHSGETVRATVHPGEDGIYFRCGTDTIRAIPENVTDTTRCTRLGPVATIEHLMSALAGLGITDAEIEVEGGELPALDGSSALYADGLEEAGLVGLGDASIRNPFERVFVHEGHQLAVSLGTGHWRYGFINDRRWPFRQVFETADVARDYRREIAPARTFGFEEDLAEIRDAEFGRGLDLESALLIGSEGYVNSARFSDEPARHKLLDAIGDLYLAGIPIQFLNVAAERSGHTANVGAAKVLLDRVRAV